MTSNGNGRMALYDHRGRKPTKAQVADDMLAAVVQAARMAATEQVQEVVEFYMAQLPELVATMIAKAFEANGLAFKPPVPEKPSELGAMPEKTGLYQDEPASDATEPAP